MAQSVVDERIWYRDLLGAARDHNIARIVPTASMTLEQQLNAVWRFSIAFSLVLFVIRRAWTSLLPAFFVSVITWFVYENRQKIISVKEAALERLDVRPSKKNGGKPCVHPTRDNPFMNVTMQDRRDFANRPEACSLQERRVRKKTTQYFEHNLYKDVNDVFERNANSRQFYTMPATTIPNDQHTFVNWLYGIDGQTCKEGEGVRCADGIFELLPA